MNVIFGSTGVVGRWVLRELIAAGAQTRAIYHSRTPSAQATESARVDLRSGEGLDEAMRGATAVFLATGDMVDQVAAELRVVERAVAVGVTRIVKLSVLGADSEAFYLAQLHREIERAIAGSGLSFTLLRPAGFMQNFVSYYGPAIRSEGVLRLPCADAKESLIDVRDIARVAAVCLGCDDFAGRALDLCGPRALGYDEMMAIISRTCGRELRYEPVSDAAFRQAMLPYTVTPRHADGLIEMFRFHRAGKAATHSPAVREVTGREPNPFESFAREHASSWMPD